MSSDTRRWARWLMSWLSVGLTAFSFICLVVLIGATGGGLGPNPTGWDPGLVYWAAVATALFFALGLFFPPHMSLRESRALAEEAGSLGLSLTDAKDARLEALALQLQPGRSFPPNRLGLGAERVKTHISRMMLGKRDLDDVRIFDYTFRIGNSSRRQWNSLRCALLRDPFRTGLLAIRPRNDRWRGGSMLSDSIAPYPGAPSGKPWGVEMTIPDEAFAAAFEVRANDVREGEVLTAAPRAWLVENARGNSYLVGAGVVLCMTPTERAISRRSLVEHLLRFRDVLTGPPRDDGL